MDSTVGRSMSATCHGASQLDLTKYLARCDGAKFFYRRGVSRSTLHDTMTDDRSGSTNRSASGTTAQFSDPNAVLRGTPLAPSTQRARADAATAALRRLDVTVSAASLATLSGVSPIRDRPQSPSSTHRSSPPASPRTPRAGTASPLSARALSDHNARPIRGSGGGEAARPACTSPLSPALLRGTSLGSTASGSPRVTDASAGSPRHLMHGSPRGRCHATPVRAAPSVSFADHASPGLSPGAARLRRAAAKLRRGPASPDSRSTASPARDHSSVGAELSVRGMLPGRSPSPRCGADDSTLSHASTLDRSFDVALSASMAESAAATAAMSRHHSPMKAAAAALRKAARRPASRGQSLLSSAASAVVSPSAVRQQSGQLRSAVFDRQDSARRDKTAAVDLGLSTTSVVRAGRQHAPDTVGPEVSTLRSGQLDASAHRTPRVRPASRIGASSLNVSRVSTEASVSRSSPRSVLRSPHFTTPGSPRSPSRHMTPKPRSSAFSSAASPTGTASPRRHDSSRVFGQPSFRSVSAPRGLNSSTWRTPLSPRVPASSPPRPRSAHRSRGDVGSRGGVSAVSPRRAATSASVNSSALGRGSGGVVTTSAASANVTPQALVSGGVSGAALVAPKYVAAPPCGPSNRGALIGTASVAAMASSVPRPQHEPTGENWRRGLYSDTCSQSLRQACRDQLTRALGDFDAAVTPFWEPRQIAP